jgi:hypothetical protein
MQHTQHIKAEFDAVYSFSKQLADRIAIKYSSVVFIALVGAWARGIPSDEDIDFVIGCTKRGDINEILKESKALDIKTPFGLRTTFICYPLSTFQDKVFSNSSKIPLLKFARIFRVIFRKTPLLKKMLLYLLGSHKAKLQKYEILPQTIQTYIPFFEKDNTLTLLQKKQRKKLETVLSESDLLLYSQNGFQKLMVHYLRNKISNENVKETLITSDIDWKEYLNRAIKMSNGQEKKLLTELHDYILAKS